MAYCTLVLFEFHLLQVISGILHRLKGFVSFPSIPRSFFFFLNILREIRLLIMVWVIILFGQFVTYFSALFKVSSRNLKNLYDKFVNLFLMAFGLQSQVRSVFLCPKLLTSGNFLLVILQFHFFVFKFLVPLDSTLSFSRKWFIVTAPCILLLFAFHIFF